MRVRLQPDSEERTDLKVCPYAWIGCGFPVGADLQVGVASSTQAAVSGTSAAYLLENFVTDRQV